MSSNKATSNKSLRFADPKCNPDSPVVVKWRDIEEAMKKIKDGIVRTPCMGNMPSFRVSDYLLKIVSSCILLEKVVTRNRRLPQLSSLSEKTRLSESCGMKLYFKKDFMQYTGSFKDRGSLNALLNLSEEEKSRGVITVSAGNHAQGLAYQGMKHNIAVSVIMPVFTPLVKINSCKRLKADIHLHGKNLAESYAYAIANRKDRVYINGFDHPDVIAGQGTVAIEMLEQVPDADYLIVPIGGGGLVAGVCVAAKHLKPSIKIIGVESDRCPGWTTATKAGQPVECQITREGAKESIADGLAVITVGCNAFATAKPLLDKTVTVGEDFIALAILRLMEHEKSVVEGAGAAGFAAILAGVLPELKQKNVVCILCGGNIDIAVVGRVIDRALAMDGRLCRFSCNQCDRPGELARLSSLIASIGANIKEVVHDRISLPEQIHRTVIHLTVEIRDRTHRDELYATLQKDYGANLLWKNW